MKLEVIARNIKDHGFRTFLSERPFLVYVWPLRTTSSLSFSTAKKPFQLYKHPHLSRALPQFRPPISIFVFRDVAEINAALHERLRSKPHDKTSALIVDPVWAEFNVNPPFRVTPFLLVIANESFSTQISMTLLAVFFLPLLSFFFSLSRFRNHNPGRNPTRPRPRRYRCLWQSVHLHRLCHTYFIACGSAKLDWPIRANRSKPPGSQILRILLHTSTSLGKGSRKD